MGQAFCSVRSMQNSAKDVKLPETRHYCEIFSEIYKFIAPVDGTAIFAGQLWEKFSMKIRASGRRGSCTVTTVSQTAYNTVGYT